MPDQLRVGVVGIGFGQAVHIPAFRGAGCSVIGVAARDYDRAVAVARRIDVCAFRDWRAIVAAPEIDIVSIAVPPGLQPAIAVAAASAGKHVFCEKPVAVDSQSAELLDTAVRRAGVCHAVNFEFPELQSWRDARGRVEAGEIGTLRRVDIDWRTLPRVRAADHWKNTPGSGGGLLGGFLSHALYNFEWFAGRIQRLRVRLGGVGPTRAEVWLECASDGFIEIDLAVAGKGSHRVTLRGTVGEIVVTAPVGGSPVVDSRIAPVRTLVERFVAAIRDGIEMHPNLTDGVRVQELLSAAHASAEADSWRLT